MNNKKEKRPKNRGLAELDFEVGSFYLPHYIVGAEENVIGPSTAFFLTPYERRVLGEIAFALRQKDLPPLVAEHAVFLEICETDFLGFAQELDGSFRIVGVVGLEGNPTVKDYLNYRILCRMATTVIKTSCDERLLALLDKCLLDLLIQQDIIRCKASDDAALTALLVEADKVDLTALDPIGDVSNTDPRVNLDSDGEPYTVVPRIVRNKKRLH